MSLSKQLSLSFLFILLLVFVSSLWLNIKNTRDFIQQQLQSHSQDTATSLGLSITPYIGDSSNLPIVETMVNAIFDNGYYRSITIKNQEGLVVLSKENPEKFNSIPDWFVALFPIQVPAKTTDLSNGWNLSGKLTVVSNAGFGYSQLWNSSVDVIGAIIGIFCISLILIFLLVKIITSPISSVVESARRISNKQFDQIMDIPKTKELKVFVNAFNTMVKKLESMFEKMTRQSEKYKQYAYSDQLTEVGNRRAFDLSMSQILSDEEQHSTGFLILIRLASLNEINNLLNKKEGDRYILSVCESIKSVASLYFENFAVYRISGTDFAIVIDGANQPKCMELTSSLSSKFKNIEKSEYKNGTAFIGISQYKFGMTYSELLTKADSALAIAENNEDRVQFAHSIKVNLGNLDWRKKIDSLLIRSESDFAAQPILATNNTVLYHEWFARLPSRNSSELIPMAQLIPASIRLDSAIDLDKMIINAAFYKLKTLPDDYNVGLNVSRMSLLSNEFKMWFLNLIQNDKNRARLTVEIPERALVSDTDSLVTFVREVKTLGVRITVERFGAQLAGLRQLREIAPDFLKLDGRYIKNISTEPDNQLFVDSLISIAHSLNVKIIAERVETLEESDWLKLHGVDHQQGYLISPPKII